MPKNTVIYLDRYKRMQDEAMEKAEELLTYIMHASKSDELNDYIMQYDVVKRTADVFYQFELAKERKTGAEEINPLLFPN